MSVTSAIEAPSPPNAVGIWAPRSLCWRAASIAALGKRASRSTASASAAASYLFGSEGWKLMPGHFAERHGLIVIIALGESIVAIGVGASGELDFGIGVAAVLGVSLTAAMWWTYFDIVAIVAGRRLVDAEPGRVQNEMARDSYSFLHLLMIAGTIMVALGLKKTIGHFDDHLDPSPPSPCSAASPSTCSATSSSATAISTRSTASASGWRSCC